MGAKSKKHRRARFRREHLQALYKEHIFSLVDAQALRDGRVPLRARRLVQVGLFLVFLAWVTSLALSLMDPRAAHEHDSRHPHTHHDTSLIQSYSGRTPDDEEHS